MAAGSEFLIACRSAANGEGRITRERRDAVGDQGVLGVELGRKRCLKLLTLIHEYRSSKLAGQRAAQEQPDQPALAAIVGRHGRRTNRAYRGGSGGATGVSAGKVGSSRGLATRVCAENGHFRPSVSAE